MDEQADACGPICNTFSIGESFEGRQLKVMQVWCICSSTALSYLPTSYRIPGKHSEEGLIYWTSEIDASIPI